MNRTTAEIEFTLPASWADLLGKEVSATYMQRLQEFLADEKAAGKIVLPQVRDWFRALELTAFDQVRVVILGQDPYHGSGQAHGLCFSVQPGVRPPPSLVNIFKELQSDLGIPCARHGHLAHWARQGVLLLNSVLTVEIGKPMSHKDRGWELFTDAIVRLLDAREQPLVFMLWGSYAQKKAGFIRDARQGGHHLVLRAAHPSPLSAHKGFLGCRHFSKANAFLSQQGLQPVDWKLPAL